MSDGMNRAILIGNIGSDPELRTTTAGSSVLSFRLATARSFLDRNNVKQSETEWHTIAVWGRRAEALARILRSGSRVGIEGEIRYREYQDREGAKRWSTTIHAHQVTLCDRAPKGSR